MGGWEPERGGSHTQLTGEAKNKRRRSRRRRVAMGMSEEQRRSH